MALELRQGRPTSSTRRRRPGGEQKKRIEDVLERLALTDPSDLCNEAKAEKCWAPRDLRSCGRPVKHLLTSCKHASLCAECSHRCDACPVCKTPISRAQPVLRLRLYDECVEAGLLPLIGEDEFRAREKEGPYWTYDSWRLCSFFDVALQHNLPSVVCHYVTDVCMDEAAVSSDPVISMLLDGAIVKEWCRRTLVSVIRSLREIYASNRVNKADSLSKEHRKLEGLCNVLETLEACLDSGLFSELQQLLDGVRMITQHLEIMEWCIRHRNLSSVPCCYSSVQEWRLAFQERKHAAASRTWPDYLLGSGTLGSKPSATLFIEDAMQNIGIDNYEFSNEYVELLWHGSFPCTSYPPDTVTAAVDLLFLRGAPDLFLAKKATFLYYLYDRHWRYPEPDHEPAWEAVIDDYANTFSISRQSMLESFVFYLLDNNTSPALEKACRLLPEIVSPSLHPKVSRVLLERGRAEVSHTVLQASGRFGLAEGVPAAPLSEAVTAVRVWVKCGLAKEAFKYLRRHRKAVKKVAIPQEDDALPRDWVEEMEVLIGELCSLCIQQNCVNDLLELPWQQADEEKILKKCFLEHALKDPSSATGSLLVVFYLQRSRFLEASSVHQQLQQIEQEFIRYSGDMEKVTQLQRTSEQRTRLLEKCLEQLPEVERDRQDHTISEDFPIAEAMQQDEVVDSNRNKQLSLPREQFSPTSLFASKKQSPMEDTTAFSQPLTTQLWNELTTPAKSPMFPSPLLNGFGPAPQSPLLSPLLGKRLRYETELLQPFRHLPNGGEAAAPGSATKKGAAQPMVVTW